MAPRRPPASILDLSNELLRDVLDCIESDPEKLVSLDRRAYLSVESFSNPVRPPPNAQQTIGNLRLTCKRFSELGAIHQFARVTARFSQDGLRRLERIAGQPHLAKHVRKFSYMVPHFYVEGHERVQQLIPTLPLGMGPSSVQRFATKVREQRQIIQSELDAKVLAKAIKAFTSLQHIQILRVQDEEDSRLLNYIRYHTEVNDLVELRWAPACSHCTKTIGAAMLAAKSPCTRFSSPMLSPQSAMALAQTPPRSFARLMEKLTCLELHFDDGFELDMKMRQLSGLFKVVFEAARNMQAVHVGFPSHRPLTLRLEELFHGVKWDKLLAFGIQAWKLDADEIIALVGRHRERLKGLRLRDVLLKDESKWKHVLAWLRENMMRLDWVSLRRIGYAHTFDEQWAAAGVEVPDDPPGGISDSDSEQEDAEIYDLPEEEEDGDHAAVHSDSGQAGPSNGHGNGHSHPSDLANTSHNNNNHNHNHNHTHNHNHHSDTSSDSDEYYYDDDMSDSDRSLDSDNGPDGHILDFPPLSPDTPNSVPWCNCNTGRDGRRSYPDSAEDLGDDGVFVTNQLRKQWEKWVVRRCPEHSAK